MKFKTIRTKMLVTLVPLIALAMVVITLVSAFDSYEMVQSQTSTSMQYLLEARNAQIDNQLQIVKDAALAVSREVSRSYKTATLEDYESFLGSVVNDTNLALGSGIWFEPYVYDTNEEYVGPYVYKDGDNLAVTYDYSNAEYDYFTQEYYLNSKETTEPVFTDPYYDPTTGLIMSSCSLAVYDGDKYIGCITVDIEISTIQEIVNSINVLDSGSAFLITDAGTYIGSPDESLVTSEASILDSTNLELAAIGQAMIDNETGEGEYTGDDGVDYMVYYGELSFTGWNLAIQIPSDVLLHDTYLLVNYLVIVCIVAILICTAILIIEIYVMSKGIVNVEKFATTLSTGDFTIDPIDVKGADEIARMGHSLNGMFKANKGIIQTIASHSVEISTCSNKLGDASVELTDKFNNMQEGVTHINEAMMTASAATQEVNASTEEVNASVTILAQETKKSLDKAQEIKKKAAEIGEQGQKSCEKAVALTDKFEVELAQSIENANIVSKVGELADAIANIAEEINLLSLNASIEAARAGEQGKGFAVVASEIGKLAGETAETVGTIQGTVDQVQEAFKLLTDNAGDLLVFLKDTVTPDYNTFLDTARSYADDADYFASVSSQVSEMSNGVHDIMGEVTLAIQNIAESSQETADVSGQILDSVDALSRTVEEVTSMSEKELDIAKNLDDVVKLFKI